MSMIVICVGSINIDEIYTIPHIVRSGETLSSVSLKILAGGKGANQSVALASVRTINLGRHAYSPCGMYWERW